MSTPDEPDMEYETIISQLRALSEEPIGNRRILDFAPLLSTGQASAEDQKELAGLILRWNRIGELQAQLQILMHRRMLHSIGVAIGMDFGEDYDHPDLIKH